MANDDKNTDALATMTLRDHFAVLTGAALIAGGTTAASVPSSEDVARISYEIADAMLAERAKGGGR